MPNQEWTLMLFTVLVHMATGVVIAAWVLQLTGNKSEKLPFAAYSSALVLAGIGLVFSFSHLGYPANAFGVLQNLGVSWLSAEVLILPLFMICTFLAVVFSIKKSSLASIFGVAAAISAVILLLVTTRVYQMRSVPSWDTELTSVFFITAAIIAGFALAAFLATMTSDQREAGFAFSGIAEYLISFCLVLQAGAMIIWANDLPSNVTISTAQLWVYTITSALALMIIRPFDKISPLLRYGGVLALLFVSQLAARMVFFHSYATAGI